MDKDELIKDSQKLVAVRADTIIFVYPDQQLCEIARMLWYKAPCGNCHRWYNWYMDHGGFHPRKSNLHESQLNFKLLQAIKLNIDIDKELIPYYGLQPTKNKFSQIHLDKDRFNLILHPKSKGSARVALIELLRISQLSSRIILSNFCNRHKPKVI
ncbi:MAG: hypothetical protein IPJ20_21955 [Flammeovirgaceae bacterium]|nr:hypothetical protein [Flammeovirgaceae bacterium]